MNITKKVIREVEIIDTDKIKVGDRLKLTYINKNNNAVKIPFEIKIKEVHEDYIRSIFDGIECNTTLDELKNYEIEKLEETQLSKFKVGDRYKVVDKLSGDTYNAEVISVGIDMVLKRDSGKHTVVQESQIGNVLLFYAIGGVVRQEDESDKEMSKEECEKKTDDFAKQLVDMIGLHQLTDDDINRPFFVGYKPHYYFKTDCNSNNINTNRYV